MRRRPERQFVRAFSLSSRIIAGKRADPIQDERLSATLPRTNRITPIRTWQKLRNFSLLSRPPPSGRSQERSGREPWENALETGKNRFLPAFFQDANYHDQIVKEQNKPTAQWHHRLATLTEAAPISGRRHGQRFDPGLPGRASTHDDGSNYRRTTHRRTTCCRRRARPVTDRRPKSHRRATSEKLAESWPSVKEPEKQGKPPRKTPSDTIAPAARDRLHRRRRARRRRV